MSLKLKKIFIVEDESDIRELIQYNLVKDNYAVETFSNAEAMLTRIRTVTPDAILLDIMLPGIDGVEACKEVRKMNDSSDISIMMLTAKGEEIDIVNGLDYGADDYMVKPFSPKILLARLRAVLRRKGIEESLDQAPLKVGGISIHPGRHAVKIEGKKVELTSSEFKTLYMLISREGWVYTRYQIVEEVHGPNYPVTDRSVDVMIAGLRKKMGSHGKFIKTVRGMGYKYEGVDYE